MVPNTVETSSKVPVPYLLIKLKVIELSWKKAPLVIFKVLLPVFNTLTAEDKYYLLNRDNSTKLFQIFSSNKEKLFSEFFATVLKYRLNFEHFETTDDPHSLHVSEFTDSKRCT